jgi:hypothetical protein
MGKSELCICVHIWPNGEFATGHNPQCQQCVKNLLVGLARGVKKQRRWHVTAFDVPSPLIQKLTRHPGDMEFYCSTQNFLYGHIFAGMPQLF